MTDKIVKRLKEPRSLTDLICSRVSNTDIIYGCNNVAQKISNSLVRVAVTRIFNNPYQSILELPVNSIDSYRRMKGIKSSIGKFGMGFFSILYWLTNDRDLLIHSNTDKDSYRAVIKRVDDNFTVTVTLGNFRKDKDHTGTDIYILANRDNFTNEDIESFNKELNKLVNIQDIYIIVNKKKINRQRASEPPSTFFKDKVIVNLNNKGIAISDDAEGISLNV